MPATFQGMLSYAHADAALADRIWHAVEAAGLTLWRDTVDSPPGGSLPRHIADAVKDHPPLVAIATKAWLERPWTRAEVQVALTQRPGSGVVMLLAARPEDLPPELLPLTSIPLGNGPDAEAAAIEDVIATLRGEDIGLVRRRRIRRSVEAALPHPGPCIGREAEIAALVKQLLGPDGCAVPLLGGPGHGKTTVALASLREAPVATRFGPRRWLVRCDGFGSSEAAWATIGATVAGHEGPRAREAALAALGMAPGALLLDNLETLVGADPEGATSVLADLSGVRGVALVCTIRGTTRPKGPAWGRSGTVRPLEPGAARAVFLAHGDGTLEDDAGLDAVVALAEGVPLVLALLGRASEGAPNARWVLDRWEKERAGLLEQGPGRLNSLAKSLGLTVERWAADSPERRLLSVLAGLPDGAAHLDLPELVDCPAAAAAQELVRAGLAWHERDRLRMLAPIREVVQARWPAREGDRARADGHYLGLALRGAELGWPTGEEAAARLAGERGNLLGSLERAIAGDRWREGAEAAWALGKYETFTGAVRVRPLLERAAARAMTANDFTMAAKCTERLGDLAFYASENTRAEDCFLEAISLYDRVGGLVGKANCTQSLGSIARHTSGSAAAETRFWDAIRLYDSAGDVLGKANCIHSLGDIALNESDHDTAEARYWEASRLYDQVRDLLGQANCIHSLGDIALRKSEATTAASRFSEAIRLYERVGDVNGKANCIQGLGTVALVTSEYSTARSRFREAIHLHDLVCDRIGLGNCARGLAWIARAEGRLDEARTLLESARSHYLAAGHDNNLRVAEQELKSLE